MTERSGQGDDPIRLLAIGQQGSSAPADPPVSLDALARAGSWLAALVQRCRRPNESLARAADWILDNDYRIHRAIRQVRRDLPPTAFARLPALEPDRQGARRDARALAIARHLLDVCAPRVDVQRLLEWLDRYQDVTPLDEAELWALPALMRLTCLERLASAVHRLDDSLDAPTGLAADTGSAVDPDQQIGDVVGALVSIDEIDWADTVARASRVERRLAGEAAAVYPRMSPATRNDYRAVIERLSRRTELDQRTVAARVVQQARGYASDERLGHVGYWLLGAGRAAFAHELGIHPNSGERLVAFAQRHVRGLYAASLFGIALGALAIPFAYLISVEATWLELVGVLALATLPASVIAVGLVHWVVPRWRAPTRLASLDPRSGIPAGADTVVAVPVIVHERAEIAPILEQLEIRHLANPDPRLSFALLSDVADADAECLPGDRAIETALVEGIETLLQRYPEAGPARFVLLHRARRFDSAESLWMGRERKRGKLEDLDALIIDGVREAFSRCAGDVGALRGTRYVITLDADTTLPPDTAVQLVCALAHPLNAAVVDADGRVTAGYSVLQPRIETLAAGSANTRFVQAYAGDGAIDIYSRAVSDVYQDLFGIASYVGKGIYDVRAFRGALRDRVPPNRILSHDLFEGMHGRVGLASEIVLYEGYPATWAEHAQRQHRWIRGDWQLLPWLARSVPSAADLPVPNRFSWLDRWRLADNLRRSVVPPALLAWFLGGWFIFPGSAVFWTLLGIGAFAPYLLDETLAGLSRVGRSRHARGVGHRLATQLLRSGLALLFLVGDARVALDAIARALWRTLVSGQRRLEWTPAALARTNSVATPKAAWRLLWPSPALAFTVGGALCVTDLSTFFIALPLLLAWVAAPFSAHALGRARTVRRDTLMPADRAFLRAVARRTWHYYDTFAGPDDHWLPPDNYQRRPVARLARRTSPTNIGLYLVSTVVARDLGFIGTPELEARARHVLDTLQRMESHRGHLLNWYDTEALAPLEPRYVSTVDSGNLAICLIALAEGCSDHARGPAVTPRALDGVIDTLQLLRDTLPGERERRIDPVDMALDALEHELVALARNTAGEAGVRWRKRLERVLVDLLADLERCVAVSTAEGVETSDERLAGRRVWLERIDHQLGATLRDLDAACPWLAVLADAPPNASALVAGIERLWPPEARLSEASERLVACHGALNVCEREGGDAHPIDPLWCARLREALQHGAEHQDALAGALDSIAARARSRYDAMHFGWLYDEARRLLRIGYDVSAGRADRNHYDLLASEARIASFVAIARRDVPIAHWFELGRPLVRPHGRPTAQSWSGSMFEYLMPPLFLPARRDTLLGDSEAHAVLVQQADARRRDLPWGVSESAFAVTDVDGNYQYQAFGSVAIGIRRGLDQDHVVAPYASLLALGVWPHAAVANLRRLDGLGALGRYGFVDALDYTASRRSPDTAFTLVETWMAHHHGMSLVAVLNALDDDRMASRVLRDPALRAVELLLHERVPWDAPSERPRAPDPNAGSDADEGFVRLPDPPVWLPARHSIVPPLHFIGNGSLSARWRADGGGTLFHDGFAVTRWSNDAALAIRGGYRLHLEEEAGEDGGRWLGESGPDDSDVNVVFAAHEVDTVQHLPGLTVRLEGTIAPHEDADVRLVTLVNESESVRRLRVTSQAEVALARPEEDERHPAFAKMFIESRVEAGHDGLSFVRRPREPGERTPCLLHRVLLDQGATLVGTESDRRRWLGRRSDPRRPAGLIETAADTAASTHGHTARFTLDPIMVLDVRIELPPGESCRVAFVSLVDRSREQLLERSASLSLARVERWFADARADVARELHRRGMDSASLPLLQELASLVLAPQAVLRRVSASIDDRGCRQEELWSHALSGDLPLIVLRMDESSPLELLDTLVRGQGYWRRRGFIVDLVVLRVGEAGYDEPLRAQVLRVLRESDLLGQLGRDGGVHLITLPPMALRARRALEDAACVVLDADEPLAVALARILDTPPLPPPLVPNAAVRDATLAPIERADDLQFDNGLGGFSADGDAYVMYLEPGATTPAPWCNVLANARFGAIVSESGLGCSWAGNSGERRLTRWTGDAVADTSGEMLWLRDEQTAQLWCVPPTAPSHDSTVEVCHALGHTRWRRHDHGLEQVQLVLVPTEAPVRLVRLELHNPGDRQRRLTATYYVDWILGALPSRAKRHVRSGYDARVGAILASNDWNADFAGRVAFLTASHAAHSVSGDRAAFIGERGDHDRPAALTRSDLGGHFAPGADACGAWQVHIDLAPGERTSVVFVVGEGESRDEAESLVAHWRDPLRVDEALGALAERWERLTGAVRVRSPDPAFDLLVDRWLIYQSVSSRLFARAGFYQASGAFGFRDQLQDALALLPAEPRFARERILDAATRQFESGDVLHWWHPPIGRGIRTRCSDDRLWLVWTTARYVERTGDDALLDRELPFLDAPELRADELDRYAVFETAGSGTLFEHCARALERGTATGAHGLPLIGTGDWNDGMDRVGRAGRGESVWLAWFRIAIVIAFAPLAEARGEGARAARWRGHAEALERAIAAHAWDGDWFVRAFDDDGIAWGSAASEECRIDAIAQAWSALADCSDKERVRCALDAADACLVDRDVRLVRLLTPPFDHTPREPGYIKSYPPGIRENGGQYTHGGAWLGLAWARLGEGTRAHEVFDLLGPVRRSASRAGAEHYRTEPYVIAADVGGVGTHEGVGGWSWYTGAASWVWQLGVSGILGIEHVPGGVRVTPALPRDWDVVEIVLRSETGTIMLRLEQIDGTGDRVVARSVDGTASVEPSIPFPAKGQVRRATVTLERASPKPASAPATIAGVSSE